MGLPGARIMPANPPSELVGWLVNRYALVSNTNIPIFLNTNALGSRVEAAWFLY